MRDGVPTTRTGTAAFWVSTGCRAPSPRSSFPPTAALSASLRMTGPSATGIRRSCGSRAAPQTLTADFLLEGATGASGHVYEPYLALTPHPDYLLPAYYGGRNLAESFYLRSPG